MSKNLYLTIVLFLLCSSYAFAQVPAWGGGADQNDLSFGFTFSYVSSYYKIQKKPDWRKPFYDSGTGKNVTDSLNSISSPKTAGFAIGFLTRYRIDEHLEARTTPSLIFADRYLAYAYPTTSEDVTKSVQSTTFDLPLELKLKSDRVGDFRAYVLGGVKYSLAIGGQKASDVNVDPLQKMVKNLSGFGSYEAGIGCDIYFEFFKLSPEIKLSNSLGNVLVPENQPFSSPISKLSLHSVMFSLIFE
jgi:hypothetical protein